MSKYIIKNCKSFISNDICELYSQKGVHLSSYIYCKDKNCLLKQIVEKCKKEIRVYRNTLLPNDGTNTLHFGRQSFAYDILQMLDIEEINPKIKRSECPYGGIDCAWCTEECE